MVNTPGQNFLWSRVTLPGRYCHAKILVPLGNGYRGQHSACERQERIWVTDPFLSFAVDGNPQRPRFVCIEPQTTARQRLFKLSAKMLTANRALASDDDIVGKCQVIEVIVTPAVYPRLFEFLHFDIQSTGQKSGFSGFSHDTSLFCHTVCLPGLFIPPLTGVGLVCRFLLTVCQASVLLAATPAKDRSWHLLACLRL